MLPVEEDEVVAEVAEQLHQVGAVDGEESADHPLAGSELGLERVRPHRVLRRGQAEPRARSSQTESSGASSAPSARAQRRAP